MDILKLVTETEQLLDQVKENLNKLNEVPLALDSVEETVIRYQRLRQRSQSWKQELVKTLGALVLRMGMGRKVFGGYRVTGGHSSGMVEGPGNNYYLPGEPMDRFIGFVQDVINESRSYLETGPQKQLQELEELSSLASQITALARIKK